MGDICGNCAGNGTCYECQQKEIASLRAEVERLTRERDEARWRRLAAATKRDEARASLASAEDSLRGVTLELDRTLAECARLREALRDLVGASADRIEMDSGDVLEVAIGRARAALSDAAESAADIAHDERVGRSLMHDPTCRCITHGGTRCTCPPLASDAALSTLRTLASEFRDDPSAHAAPTTAHVLANAVDAAAATGGRCESLDLPTDPYDATASGKRCDLPSGHKGAHEHLRPDGRRTIWPHRAPVVAVVPRSSSCEPSPCFECGGRGVVIDAGDPHECLRCHGTGRSPSTPERKDEP